MTNQEIQALIDKYHLVQLGDKIGTYDRSVTREMLVADVAPHKVEIIRYLAAQREAKVALSHKRQETFDAIPGVRELRTAREQFAAWKKALNRMMDTGDCVIPQIVHPTQEQVTALEAKYPLAVFALEAQWRAGVTENYKLGSIWCDTYRALQDGENPETVKAEHDRRMAAFVADSMWD